MASNLAHLGFIYWHIIQATGKSPSLQVCCKGCIYYYICMKFVNFTYLSRTASLTIDYIGGLLSVARYAPNVIATSMDHSMITWLLVATCSPHCVKNPYLVAKIIEVLFVLNPGFNPHTEDLYNRVLSHPISETHLPSCLMKFYTGMWFLICSKVRIPSE